MIPRRDGLETAKDTYRACPSRRLLMFASAYAARAPMEAVKSLNGVKELDQEPVDPEKHLADLEGDKVLFEQLERLIVSPTELKDFAASPPLRYGT